MFRCVQAAIAALVFSFALSNAALAQVQRNFPQNALRGTLVIDNPPDVTLNGSPARLGAGARIYGHDNLLKMSASLVGSKLAVHYTVDPLGLIKDVWLLNEHEIARKPWPETVKEAQAWQFDPIAQTWTKP